MNAVTYKKGRHYAKFFALLRVLSCAVRGGLVVLEFTRDSRYRLDKGDQQDWSKIIGYGAGWTKKGLRKTEDLFVWRYNDKSNRYEVAIYKRRNYKMILPTEWESYKEGEKVYLSLSLLKRHWLPLGAYFGGNRTAPRRLSYKMGRG